MLKLILQFPLKKGKLGEKKESHQNPEKGDKRKVTKIPTINVLYVGVCIKIF